MLQHVDAVEVVVADGVDRGLERDPQREQPEAEVQRVLGLHILDPSRQPGVPEEKGDQAHVNGGVERPAHPMSLRLPRIPIPPVWRQTCVKSARIARVCTQKGGIGFRRVLSRRT